MIGSDPVSAVTRGQRWEQADEGRDDHGRRLDDHRGQLAPLPADAAPKIRLDSALTFFARKE